MRKNPYMRVFSFLILIILFLNSCAYCYSVEFFSKFNDNCLENYILQALQNNHELKQANYVLEQYRYNIKEQQSILYPKASVSANYFGSHIPNKDPNFLIKENLFVLPFFANYELDLLLKNVDKVRSKRKLYQAQKAYTDGLYISLLVDVATCYINLITIDYLIEKQLEIVSSKEKNVNYNQNKFNFGLIGTVENNDFKRDLEEEKIIYNNLVKKQNSLIYNLKLLIGQSADNSDELARGKISDFEYIEKIPNSISSDYIYKRPDVIEIENKLKSAKIDVTVAKKEFFPSFNITGFLTFDTAGGGNFFSWGSSFAYLIAGASQDIFMGGKKLANLKIKKNKYYELMENYKQIDLKAIKEINDTLNSIKQDTLAESNSKEKLKIESKNFSSAQKKLNRGTISKINYVNNKVKLKQAQQMSAALKTVRLVDYFNLYKAVGGEL